MRKPQGTHKAILFLSGVTMWGTGTAKDMDIAVLVDYFPSIQRTLSAPAPGADERSISNTQAFAGNKAETWMGFISEGGADAADCVYTG